MPRIPGVPAGSLAAAMMVYRTWQRLPERQRAQLLEAARVHGPRVAAAAAGAAKAHSARRRAMRRPPDQPS